MFVIHYSYYAARHFVGLAGPPGAGKSTLAYEVARRVNKIWPEKASSFDSEVKPPDVAVVLPMDGFHLYRYELDAMEVSFLMMLSIFYYGIEISMLIKCIIFSIDQVLVSWEKNLMYLE